VTDGPIWLTTDLVLALHRRALASDGGLEGIRDPGALDSALARPRSAHALGEGRLVVLAAMYAQSLAKNHAFLDGNKRVAFLATFTFLGLNGREFSASEDDTTRAFRGLASSEMSFEAFTRWLEVAARDGDSGSQPSFPVPPSP